MIPDDSPLANAGRAMALFMIGSIILSCVSVICGITMLVIGKKRKRNGLVRAGRYVLALAAVLIAITIYHHLSWI